MSDITSLSEIPEAKRPFNRFKDSFFKYLLATEEHKRFLLDLLNAIFEDRRPECVKGRICDLSLEDRELSSKNDVEKNCRLDIRATTDQGQILLSDNTPVALMQLDGKDEIFESVLEAEKMFVRDREAMLRYEARERYEMDMASLKGESRREGRAEERIEIAHNMLKNGFSLEQIKLATRLTDDEMAALS